jgi:hypothetical protein
MNKGKAKKISSLLTILIQLNIRSLFARDRTATCKLSHLASHRLILGIEGGLGCAPVVGV